MPLTKGQRQKMHQKYAHLIGGVDADGNEHKLAPTEEQRDVKRAQELFAVRDYEKENTMWEFVNGRRVLEFIMAGRYDVEYLGKNKDLLANKKVRQKMLEQVEQQVSGKKAKHEKSGVFEPEEYYQNLLKERTDVVKKRFKEYDDSKKEKDS
jgi:hypothetical protein